ncbi:MAG: tripartite tricarboxylate transporter substrate binding protein [Xanthobacteraceae bacterium]
MISTSLAAFTAHAQDPAYPTRPVTVISDAAPGAGPDIVIRTIGARLTKLWGQQVVVINHPGANGSLAARAAADAANDGYALYAPALSAFIALPTVAPNLPVKLPHDFLPVGFAAEQPMFVAVSPTLGVTSLPQLIALARREPGKISIASTGIGHITQLTGILLEERASIRLLSVPYTHGPASAIGDVASGRVSLIIENYAGIIGAVRAKQVKLIAVASAERLPEFPDLPTMAETLPGFTATGWAMFAAPVGTPAPIITKVSSDLTKVESDPDLREKFAALGVYTRVMTPAQVLAFVVEQQRTFLPLLQKISAK